MSGYAPGFALIEKLKESWKWAFTFLFIATISGKSSSNTFWKSMLFGIEAHVLFFAFSANFLIPLAPKSMLCRRRSLCCLRNRKNQLGNVSKTLENRILLPSVSTLLSPIARS